MSLLPQGKLQSFIEGLLRVLPGDHWTDRQGSMEPKYIGTLRSVLPSRQELEELRFRQMLTFTATAAPTVTATTETTTAGSVAAIAHIWAEPQYIN
jgi:hypothetical protein